MPPLSHRLTWAEFSVFKSIAAAIAVVYVVVIPPLLRPHFAAFVAAFGGSKGAFVFGSCCIHLATTIICNLAFTVLYVLKLPSFERFKTHGAPWQWERGEKARQALFRLVLLAIGLTLLNNAIGTALAFGNFDVLASRGLTDADDAWPSAWTLAWQLGAFIVAEDTFFYFCHRTLHAVPWLYANVHKLHHRWVWTLAIAAEATHPLEFVLGNGLPFLLGPLLVGRVHLFTVFMWLVLRIVETCDGHSGYDLPFMPQRLMPFSSTSGAHDAHHAVNTGNYGSFLAVWDTVLHTEIPEGVLERSFYHPSAETVAREKVA